MFFFLQVITWFQNRRAKLKRDLEELKADVSAAKSIDGETTPPIFDSEDEYQAYRNRHKGEGEAPSRLPQDGVKNLSLRVSVSSSEDAERALYERSRDPRGSELDNSMESRDSLKSDRSPPASPEVSVTSPVSAPTSPHSIPSPAGS